MIPQLNPTSCLTLPQPDWSLNPQQTPSWPADWKKAHQTRVTSDLRDHSPPQQNTSLPETSAFPTSRQRSSAPVRLLPPILPPPPPPPLPSMSEHLSDQHQRESNSRIGSVGSFAILLGPYCGSHQIILPLFSHPADDPTAVRGEASIDQSVCLDLRDGEVVCGVCVGGGGALRRKGG